MSNQETDRTHLTFSQAEGIDPLPQPAALGELPQKARLYLWNLTYLHLSDSTEELAAGFSGGILNEPWMTIMRDYHTSCLRPMDEFDCIAVAHLGPLKDLFLNSPYNRIFDFLQITLRHVPEPPEFRDVVESVLSGCMCAYTIAGHEATTTIVPIALPEQRESIKKAFQMLKSGPFDGAQSHLRQSADCINNRDLAGSVRESIHAVESVAKRLDASAGKTLKPALDALSQKVSLHAAFKNGIENFYGYTNDEKGIRHALLEGQANVDIDDAVFMFGACTAFAAYLVNKSRKAGLLNAG